jgi:high-affinity iron transporter
LLLSYIKRLQLRKWIWFGAIAGVAVSLILGIIFVSVFYLANTKLLDDKASAIFKGCICWVAALLITVVSFAMLKFYNLERKWKRKLEDAFSRNVQAHSYRWSMFLLAGSATLREGIESVLFLTGVSAGASVKSVILPGLVGIALGALCGIALYYSGRSIQSLKWFFIVSALLLLFISAGMVINGTMFFQIAGLFGTMFPYEWRPWANRVLWDVTSCCDPNTNQGWAMMRALFGWQGQQLNLQFLYFMMYWALTLTLLYWKYHTGTLTDRKEAELAAAESRAQKLDVESGESDGRLSEKDKASDGSEGDVVEIVALTEEAKGQAPSKASS